MTDKRLSGDELTAYLHRIQFGNHEASQWAATQIAEHIVAIEAELAEFKKFAKIESERDNACIHALEASLAQVTKDVAFWREEARISDVKLGEARALAERYRVALEWCAIDHNGEKACAFLLNDPGPCTCHVAAAKEALSASRDEVKA